MLSSLLASMDSRQSEPSEDKSDREADRDRVAKTGEKWQGREHGNDDFKETLSSENDAMPLTLEDLLAHWTKLGKSEIQKGIHFPFDLDPL